MLILVGDNPKRTKSEVALAKLCGVCPIPASSGKTNRMRDHEATQCYVIKRTAQGKSKREVIRCLKRYIVREIYRELCVPSHPKRTA